MPIAAKTLPNPISQWSFRAILVLGLVSHVAGAPAAFAGHKPHAKKSVPEDPEYAAALNAVNQFLHAWQSGDLEAGMVLLTNRARSTQDPEHFEDFFAAAADRGFEVARGTGGRGRYRFPVVLVTREGARLRRRTSEIIAVNTGKNDWAVDKLP